MDKIKELLKSLGASDELAKSICEEFERYTTSLKESYEKDYTAKIEKAKQICVEEVQAEKINLARKVGVFLESKAKAIEAAIKSQRISEDTEATSLLKRTKMLLEGIMVEKEGSSNRELQSLTKKAERLEKALGSLKEERDRAIEKANRANEIAVKTLRKNQLLESKINEAKAVCECGGILGEGEKKCKKCAEKAKEPKVESKEQPKAPITESRLDTSRAPSAQPRSTRITPKSLVDKGTVPTEVDNIASQMPE